MWSDERDDRAPDDDGGITSMGSPEGPDVDANFGRPFAPENKPASGGPDEDRGELREKCRDERETMTPRETAECAGTALAEEFEREEDGGS